MNCLPGGKSIYHNIEKTIKLSKGKVVEYRILSIKDNVSIVLKRKANKDK